MSTRRKSHATMPDAWETRNRHQVGEARRGAGAQTGYSQDPRTVVPGAEKFALDRSISPPRILTRLPCPDQDGAGRFRCTWNGAKLWATGMSSMTLMLTYAGSDAAQDTASAMSAGPSGRIPA